MYKKLKNKTIGKALEKTDNIFDITKLELMFNLILFYIIVYSLGTIPIIIGKYWLIVAVQIIGISFIFAMAIALIKTKSIKLPRKIWFVSGIFFTISSVILNKGEASYLTYGFTMMNIVISFLVLNRFLRNIAVTYYLVFIVTSLSIKFNFIPKLELPFDLSREHEFFQQPNIYAVLIAFSMIAFIIYSFIRRQEQAKLQVTSQKEKLSHQKFLLEKKNETIKLSVDLAARIQNVENKNELILKSKVSEYYSYHEPRLKLSGEFFWEKKINDSVYFALVDTGVIGVGGAMFAFLIKNGLEKISAENFEQTPKKMLISLHHFISKKIHNSSNLSTHTKITFCQLNLRTQTLFVSGVAQPIFIQSENELKLHFPKNKNLNYLDESEDFDEGKFQLKKNDVVYLFTDGVMDIEKSDDDEKKYTQFHELLKRYKENDFKVKCDGISSHYKTKKSIGKQNDDITIIGFKM